MNDAPDQLSSRDTGSCGNDSKYYPRAVRKETGPFLLHPIPYVEQASRHRKARLVSTLSVPKHGGQEEDSLKTALLFSVYCLHILHLGGGKLRLGPRSSL